MAKGDMTFNREQWVKDLGQRVPVLNKDDFTRVFLPQLPPETVDQTHRRLEVKGALAKVARDSKAQPPPDSLWTHFPARPSRIKVMSSKRSKRKASGKAAKNKSKDVYLSVNESETDIFKRLETICAEIKSAGSVVLGRPARTKFRTDPNYTFKCEESSWNGTFRVDGYDYLDSNAEERPEDSDELKDGEIVDGSDVESEGESDDTHEDGSDIESEEESDDTDEDDGEWMDDARDAGPANDNPDHLQVEERDAVYVVEAKINLSTANEFDNACKIIGAASHHLFVNPCRRYMYGLTFEDGQARMWCFTRSAVVVSQSFDYLTDVDILIHFVLSMAFSDEDAIGYDSTVKRVEVSGQWQYMYRVAGVWYITVECLSNFRSVRVIGRATRVWKVKRWEDVDSPDAPHFALKDVWLDEEARSESQIQNDIFKNFNRVNPVDMNIDKARQYFMTIRDDEDVTIEGSPDITRHLPPFDLLLLESPDAVKLEQLFWSGARSSAVVGSVSGSPKDANRPPRPRNPLYPPKRHRRILFEEVGQTLNEVLDHRKVFGALADVVQGLKVLYSAGYVHRDISTGNVLLCGDRGKISDLEYARSFEVLVESREPEPCTKLDNPFNKQLKTGTPAFMAIEVQAGVYLFRPTVATQTKPQAPTVYRFGQPRSGTKPEVSNLNSQNVLVHNYIHDLESVWWIANHTILSSVPVSEWETDFNVELQRDLLTSLFPHSTGLCTDRYNHFCSRDTFCNAMTNIPALKCQPPAEALESIRDRLHTTYGDFYQDMETFRCQRQFRPLYEAFHTRYQEAKAVALGLVRPIDTVPMSEEQLRCRLLRLTDLNTAKVGGKRTVDSLDGKNESDRGSKRRSISPARSDKENACARKTSSSL